MIRMPSDFASLKGFILTSYEKQQRAVVEEFGGDEDEVARRVSRLRDWAEFCERERNEFQRFAIFTELFGKREPPRLGAMSRGAKCQECFGDGAFWSESCTPRQHNPNKRYGPGFVACRCEIGKSKNKAIREHGKRAERISRHQPREEF